MDERPTRDTTRGAVGIDSVATLALPEFTDRRGRLVAADFGSLPFVPARCFVVRDVPSGETRADHANLGAAEVLVCVAGQCTVEVRDGDRKASFSLDRPAVGVHVPEGLWIVCRDFSSDAVLLVFASAPYDPADQLSDYHAFVSRRAAMAP